MRFVRAALALALLVWLPTRAASHGQTTPVITRITHSGGVFGTYSLIELHVSLAASYRNPFDPAQIDLHAVFRSPAGAHFTVNGFYFQDFARVGKASGPTVLRKQGAPQWLIRFAAPTPGNWTYRVYLRDNTGRSTSSAMCSPVHVVQSRSPGYLRVSRYDRSYLAFDNGQPYFPAGENMAFWYHPLGIQDYYYWLNGKGKLHDQGATFIRIWMAPPTFAVDYAFPLGNYTSRMANAWAFDQVLALAVRDGIEVLPTLQQHANFEVRNDWPWDWRHNPYNRARGGPARSECDFFSNPAAIAQFQRNLRYVVARWGYSTTILGWELFSEVDLVTGFRSCAHQVLRWHQIMIDTLHALDPAHRLITTSFAHMPGYPPIWRLPGISIVQSNHYSYNSPSYIVADLRALRQYGKPEWMGEYGFSKPTFRNKPDRTGQYIHIGQWASLMSGAAGSGFNWWWADYVDSFNTYDVFRALPHFLAGMPLDRQSFTPLPPQSVRLNGTSAQIFRLQGKTMALIWVLMDRAPPQVEQVSLPAPMHKSVRIQWWDTWHGVPLSTLTIRPQRGVVSLHLPGKADDYAARMWE